MDSMFRSILLPTLVACFIAFPLLYHKSTSHPLNLPTQNSGSDYDFYVSNPTGVGPPSQIYRTPFKQTYNPVGASATRAANAATRPNSSGLAVIPASMPRPISGGISQNVNTPAATQTPQLLGPSRSENSPPIGRQGQTLGGPLLVASHAVVPAMPIVDFSQMTPDFGATQTQTFRGNAYGPDLTAQPMQFVPVSNFQEIFRFDVSPTWVKQRWERLSAIPVENGLHGLRTALVTGTNSWDLNGSLTYYFDQNHRTQRIGFRGWVGDPSRLIELATQHFGLKPMPTHWAGLYVAEFGGSRTGGLLMKDPDTIDRRNQVQRTAVIMEINQPSGESKLSSEFEGFMTPAMPIQ